MHQLAQIQGAAPAAPALPPTRRSRGSWTPAPAGPYRLPRVVEAQLVTALAGFKNRDAALQLAVHLARYWTIPRLLGLPFPVDRRAMAERSAVDLTEARVRGALRVLEKVGFIERDPLPRGSRHRLTEAGLHRKPVLWRFTETFLKIFAQANVRAKARQARNAATARPASPIRPRPAPLQLAQKDIPSGKVFMGDESLRLAPANADADLEAALGRLLAGVSGMVKRGSRA